MKTGKRKKGFYLFYLHIHWITAYSGVPNNRVDVFVFPVLEMHARLDYLDNLLIFPFTKKMSTRLIRTNSITSPLTKKSLTLLFGINSIVKKWIIILILTKTNVNNVFFFNRLRHHPSPQGRMLPRVSGQKWCNTRFFQIRTTSLDFRAVS